MSKIGDRDTRRIGSDPCLNCGQPAGDGMLCPDCRDESPGEVAGEPARQDETSAGWGMAW